jgi:hypothetical protein
MGLFYLRLSMDHSKDADQKRGRGRPMGKLHQDDVRSKIKVGQLLKTLEDHALTGGEDMSLSRMKAIEILLRKSLPDLSAVTVKGPNDDGSMTFNLLSPWLNPNIAKRNEG